eukprot:12594813-Alexandrium_andersonii.AAC.1
MMSALQRPSSSPAAGPPSQTFAPSWSWTRQAGRGQFRISSLASVADQAALAGERWGEQRNAAAQAPLLSAQDCAR